MTGTSLVNAAAALRTQLATVPGVQKVLQGLPQNGNYAFPLAWVVFRSMTRLARGQITKNLYMFDVRVAVALGDVAATSTIDETTITAAEAWIEQFTNTVPAAVDASTAGAQAGTLGGAVEIARVDSILSGEGPDGYVVIGGLLCRSVHFVVVVEATAPYGSTGY